MKIGMMWVLMPWNTMENIPLIMACKAMIVATILRGRLQNKPRDFFIGFMDTFFYHSNPDRTL
ncbi:MAG: hypothetical protein L7F78_08545, partial [Syntrophales bacterium LBB04]|nr:hypothetical protein [Syntrophales bacterium LBB04]